MQWRGSFKNLLIVLLGVLLCLQFSVRAVREGSTAMSTGLFPAAPNTPAEDSSTAGSQLRGQSSAPSSALTASSRDPSPAASEAAAAAARMQEDYEREDQRLRMMQRALGKVPSTELTRLVDELEESQAQAQAQTQSAPGEAASAGSSLTGSSECSSFATMRAVVDKIATLHGINTKREEGLAASAGGAVEPSSVAISAAEAAILPATHEAACMHYIWELRQAELKKYTEGGGGRSGASTGTAAGAGAGGVSGGDSADRASSRGGPVHEMKKLAAVLEKHFAAYKTAISGTSPDASSPAPDAATLTQHLPMALIDLESYLEDIDNARDFHTIGGWNVLLRYLDAGARAGAGSGGNEGAPLQHRSRISSLVAWCMGTAVKNNAQYQAWMLEGPGGTGAGAGAGDSAVHSLIRLLQIPLPAGAGEGSCGAAAGSAAPSPPGTVDVAESVAELHRKALYALSAASGNNIALKDHMAEAAADVKQAKGGAFAAVMMELLHGSGGSDGVSAPGSTTVAAYAPRLLERSRKVWNLLADLADEWEYEIEDTEAAAAANAAAAAVTAAGGSDMSVGAAAEAVAAAQASATTDVVVAHNVLTTEFCSPQWRDLLHRSMAEVRDAGSAGSGASALAGDANEIDLASLDLDGDDEDEERGGEGDNEAAVAAAASRARASSLRGVERAIHRVEEKLPAICAW